MRKVVWMREHAPDACANVRRTCALAEHTRGAELEAACDRAGTFGMQVAEPGLRLEEGQIQCNAWWACLFACRCTLVPDPSRSRATIRAVKVAMIPPTCRTPV